MLNKVLLTGSSGQLGTELKKYRQYITPSHKEMDITNDLAVKDYLLTTAPDLIVHAAAYTNTTLPDRDAQAAFDCFRVNVIGTRTIVKYAKCPIVFISSETCLEPYNFYAITKYQAELEVMRHNLPILTSIGSYKIIRTSFRFDPYEYPQAPSDMLTIGDSCHIIAPLINKAISLPILNQTVYVGTGVKTVYELAKKTRPDVKEIKRADLLPFVLPAMESLLNI